MKSRLKFAFDDLARSEIDSNLYRDEWGATAFDVSTSETFIIGIADKLMSNDALTSSDLTILRRQLLVDTIWTANDGTTIDLREQNILIQAARKIEKLREVCLEVLREKGFGE
jgi:hypothetical protein